MLWESGDGKNGRECYPTHAQRLRMDGAPGRQGKRDKGQGTREDNCKGNCRSFGCAWSALRSTLRSG